MRANPANVYRLFFNPGEVVEIRALGLAGKYKAWDGWATRDGGVFGYFDNGEDFGNCARALDNLPADRRPDGIYFIPNLPNPDLISRAPNRIVAGSKKRPSTSNKDILTIRWLLIDLDPARPAGISSTKEELANARELARKVIEFLKADFSFPEPIKALSGNGYHLNYRIEDQPNEFLAGKSLSAASETVKQCLAALAAHFKDPAVKFDQVVYNAARLWKLYGTWARKGYDTEDRPHRQSYLFDNNPKAFGDVPVVSWKQVQALAAAAPEPEKGQAPPPAVRKKSGRTHKGKAEPMLGNVNVKEVLEHFGVALYGIEEKGGATWYLLKECANNSDHKNGEAAIVQSRDTGKITYSCFHDSCRGFRWKDFKQAALGGDIPLTQFREGYDPNYGRKKGKGGGTGAATIVEAHEECYLDNICLPTECDIAGANELTHPYEIDPGVFYRPRPDSSRPMFVLNRLATFTAAWLSPICSTSGVFWRYADGVWRKFPESTVRHLVSYALKDQVQASMINDTVSVLKAKIDRPETYWEEHEAQGMINCANGMADLRGVDINDANLDPDAMLVPHDPDYCSRRQVAASWSPEEEPDLLLRSLQQIFPEGRNKVKGGALCEGDDKIRLLKQFAGYILLPTTKYEKAMFFYGTGANGKGTVTDTLISVLGSHNTMDLSIDELGKSFNVPYLQGKMLVTSAEINYRDNQGVQNLKKCISGDPVSGEVKFGERIEFRNNAKFLFSMNDPPSGITDKSWGFRRKFLLLHFGRRFGDDEIDPDLKEKLAETRNAVFCWMVQGALELRSANRFFDSETIRKDKHSFERQLDPLAMYIDECLIIGDENRYEPKEDLFRHYGQWCEESRYNALGRNRFYTRLCELIPSIKERRREIMIGSTVQNRWCFLGITISKGE